MAAREKYQEKVGRDGMIHDEAMIRDPHGTAENSAGDARYHDVPGGIPW
jgi:hypothetical protein